MVSNTAWSVLHLGLTVCISICIILKEILQYVMCFGLPSIKNDNPLFPLIKLGTTNIKYNNNNNTVVFISGGEGSRTPVQCKFHINFYIVSLLLLILQTKLFVFPNVRTITLIDLLSSGRTTLSDYRSQHNWVKRFMQPLSPKRRVLIQKYRQLKNLIKF